MAAKKPKEGSKAEERNESAAERMREIKGGEEKKKKK